MDAADQLAAIGKALKEMGDKGLNREFSKAVAKATKPLKAELKQSALATLPKRGGLAAKVAGAKYSTRRANSARAVGIRITVTGQHLALARMDKGQVRHPVFADGHKGRDEWTWVNQPVTPGWHSKVIEKTGAEVGRQIQEAMDMIARKIEHAR